MIIMKKREAEHRGMKFTAAMKGIDLDAETEEQAQAKIEEVQRRAAIKLHGEREVEIQEFADFGFKFESD